MLGVAAFINKLSEFPLVPVNSEDDVITGNPLENISPPTYKSPPMPVPPATTNAPLLVDVEVVVFVILTI